MLPWVVSTVKGVTPPFGAFQLGWSGEGPPYPGMLLRVNRICDRGVVFNKHLFVGLGAAMMGGAVVIRRMGVGIFTLCSVGVAVTVCSPGALGGGGGNRWESSSGKVHSWRGCVMQSSVGMLP